MPSEHSAGSKEKSAPENANDSEALVRILEASGDYQVLRRLKVPESYSPAEGVSLLRGLVVDVETTGLDVTREKIIELGAVPFDFDSSGRVYAVHAPLSYFEDPGKPIPQDVVEITGITNADVSGQHIDDEAVLTALDPVVLVIAHNAAFDRRMLERRFPAFEKKYWACSMQEVPWQDFGSRSRKLDYLLYRVARAFHTGHRAADDCLATLHLLTMTRDGGGTALASLLKSARRPTLRLWATGAPIEVKDALKRRHYRWFPGSETRAKAWYLDLFGEEELKSEQEWLHKNAYDDRPNPNWLVERFTGMDRYSRRMELR